MVTVRTGNSSPYVLKVYLRVCYYVSDMKRKNYVWRSAVPWLRRLLAGLPPRRHGFDPSLVHVGSVVDKVTQGQVFSLSTSFSPVCIIPPMFHTHLHINNTAIRRTSGRSLRTFEQSVLVLISGGHLEIKVLRLIFVTHRVELRWSVTRKLVLDGSVDVGNRYGRDGLGIESRWGRDFPRQFRPGQGSTQSPAKWVLRFFLGGKAAGAWPWLPPTPSRAERYRKRGTISVLLVWAIVACSMVGFSLLLASLKIVHLSKFYQVTCWSQYMP